MAPMARSIVSITRDDAVAAHPEQGEVARYWREPQREGLEMLRAKFVTHAFPRHTHEEHFVIGGIESGVQACVTKGSQGYFVAGTVVLLNPATVHTGRAFDGIGYAYRAFYPSLSLVQEIYRQTGLSDRQARRPYFRAPFSFHDPDLARRLLTLHALLETGDISPLERDSRLLSLFQLAFQRYGEALPERTLALSYREPGAVQRTRDYLNAHAEENVTLETLAAIAGLSPYHLLRVFRDTVGIPPHAYQTQIRVERAKALLAGGMPIAQAAITVGFVDQSHLTRHFKRLLGVSPGTFRHAASKDSNFIQAAPNARVLV